MLIVPIYMLMRYLFKGSISLLTNTNQFNFKKFEMSNATNEQTNTNTMVNSDIFDKITKLLNDKNITYRSVQHEPTYTSEESSIARGEDLLNDGKAILMKIDDNFRLFVLSGVKKIDSKKIKEFTKGKKIRFATSNELMQQTSLVPGCVPPFGEPILPFKLYVDESIVQNERIAFNAGTLTNSIIMKTSDYFNIANAIVFRFTSN